MIAEQFLFRASTFKTVAGRWRDDPAEEDQGQSAAEPVSAAKRPRTRKSYEHGPDEGNRWDFFKSELARFLERVPVVSEEIALNYANLIRDTMLNPRPTEQEWHSEYRPAKICKRLVAKEEKRRETNGGGDKDQTSRSRDEVILAAKAEIEDSFPHLAIDALKRVHFYREDLGRYEDDDHETFFAVLRRHLESNVKPHPFVMRAGDQEGLINHLTARKFWDHPPIDKINVRNGILDITTGTLAPHTPDFLYPNQFDISWDASAECPKTMQFLNDVLHPEEIPFAFELIGYVLTPDNGRQKGFLLHGPGKNGKSVLLKLITRILGRRNFSAIPLALIEGNVFASSGLVGKLANFEFDMQDSRLPGTQIFKSVVGEDNAINVQRKYHNATDVWLYSRFLMSCNRYPRSSDNSEGFRRKWIVLSMDKFNGANVEKIRDSETIVADLMTEASGILRKSVEAAIQVRERRAFTETARMLSAKNEFLMIIDSLNNWLDDNTISASNVRVKQGVLRAAYNHWCRSKDYSELGEKEFAERVLQYRPGVDLTMSHGNRYFSGLGLRSDYPEAPEQDYKSKRLSEQIQFEGNL